MNVVILAAGDFPTHPVPLRALKEADFVVCCDSAYVSWKTHPCPSLREGTKRMPPSCVACPSPGEGQGWGYKQSFIVIGDGDSLSESDKAALGDRWVHVAEQDYNDLHKAMAWAASRFTPHPPSRGDAGECSYTILGATGRREDHTLGNISYLVTFAEEYPETGIEMLTDHGSLIAMKGQRHFPAFPHQQVSIFVMDPATAVTSQGLRWPLCGMHPRTWWQASLNESLADSFTLSADGWIVVFRTHEPKV